MGDGRNGNETNHGEECIWNSRFQSLLSKKDSEDKFMKLASLAREFQHVAQVFGRVIISEKYLSAEEKTITPIQTIDGGEKYVYRGILFKFATDVGDDSGRYIYGGNTLNDGFAMKAAGNELKSLARIVDSGGVFEAGVTVPLMVLIDYLGFRLTAISLLPIKKHSNQNGSEETKPTRSINTKFNKKLKEIFTQLKLRGHWENDKYIYACGGTQGHWGTDEKFYLIDFAQLFPPESLEITKQYFPVLGKPTLYKLLRPELVASNADTLSPDVFVGSGSEDSKELEEGVTEATKRLVEEIIPQISKTFIENNWGNFEVVAPSKSCEKLEELIHEMHRNGVNVRFLGVLRSHVIDNSPTGSCVGVKKFLLTEMCARVCKNIVRAMMREKMKDVTVPSEEPYRDIVVKLFNIFSQHSKDSNRFWTSNQPPVESDRNDKTFEENEKNKLPINENSPEIPVESIEFYVSKFFSKQDNLGTSWNGHSSSDILVGLLPPIKICLKSQFGYKALTKDEWNSNTNLSIIPELFFRRLVEQLGIVISEKVYPKLSNGFPKNDSSSEKGHPFEFMDTHISEFSPKIKQMHFVDNCDGRALWEKVCWLEKNSTPDKDTLEDMCSLAKEKLQQALLSVPGSEYTLFYLILIEVWLADKSTDHKMSLQRYHSCMERLKVVESLLDAKLICTEKQNELFHKLNNLKAQVNDKESVKNQLATVGGSTVK